MAVPIRSRLIFDRPTVASVEELFDVVTDRAARIVGGVDAGTLSELLLHRERELPTATPEGVAFPHAVDRRIVTTAVAVVRLAPPLPFGTVHPPCGLAFILFASDAEPWRHVRLLARLARIVSDPQNRAALDTAADRAALRRVLVEADGVL